MDAITTFFIEIALRSSLVLGVALLATGLMFRRSAAERHFVLTLGIALLLLLPAGLLAMPSWRIGIWNVIPRAGAEGHGASGAQTGVPVHESQWKITTNATDGQTSRFPISDLLAGIFLLGASALGARLAWGWYRLERVRRKARRFPASDELGEGMGKVEVLVSDDTRVAFVMGLLHPAIVIPASAVEWPEDHLKMVFYHELGHLRRGDHWVQAMCCVARLLYWWQPLMWISLRAQQRDRELACDDSVIERFRASDYAELLLNVAGEAKGRRLPSSGLAMAASSNLEERICSVLDGARCRNLPGRNICGVLSAIALAAGMLMCSARLGATESQSPSPSPSPEKSMAKPGPATDPKYVQIQSKFAEITEDVYEENKSLFDSALEPMDSGAFTGVLKIFDALKGADLLSAPTVVTKEGNTSEVIIARKFRYPTKFESDAKGGLKPVAFETRNLGVELELVPTLNGGKIWLTGTYRLTDFAGFTRSEAGVQIPAFDVHEARLLRGLGDDQWVCIALPGERPDEQPISDRQQDGHVKETKHLIAKKMILFLGVRVVGKPNFTKAADLKAEARSLKEKSLPYGVPVPNKPGFVASPYAPYSSAVDVRGLSANAEVKCPHTGKMFLVP